MIIESSFIWKAIFTWYYVKASLHKGNSILLPLVSRTFFCAASSVETKKIRGSGNAVPFFYEVTYFKKDCGVRRKPASYYPTHSMPCNKILVFENMGGMVDILPWKYVLHNAFVYTWRLTNNTIFGKIIVIIIFLKKGVLFLPFLMKFDLRKIYIFREPRNLILKKIHILIAT